MFTLRLSRTDSNTRRNLHGEEYQVRTSFGYLGAILEGAEPTPSFHQGASDWVLLSGFPVNLDSVLRSLTVAQPLDAQPASRTIPASLAWIYRRAGIDGLRRLEGCFALCLVDFDDGSIHVLRDRLGGRSAYVQVGPEQVLVASHAHRIAAYPTVRGEENPDYLALRVAYAGFPPPGTTPFRDIEEVLPGEHWQIRQGRVRRQRQALEIPSRFERRGVTDAIEGLRSRLETSVAAQTAGHDRFAAMLSGGLDSTPATALMARHLGHRGGRLQAVSWSLAGARSGDETRRIEETAALLRIELRLFNGHECVPFSGLDSTSINPGFIELNAFRPLHHQAIQRAREEGCEAIVNFTAGDFLYPTPAHTLSGLIRGREWASALGIVARLMTTWNRGRRPWRSPMLRGYLRGLRARQAASQPYPYRLNFLTDAARKSLPPLPAPFAEAEAHPVPAFARFMQTTLAYHRAQESYFAERLGLGYLDPYQSEELARYMLALPFSYSYRNQQSKWIMRQLARERIPESIRTTPRTGNLLGFLKFGYRKHHAQIVQVIAAGRPHWSRVLRTDRVDELLQRPHPSEADLVLVCQLLGYCLWCQVWK